MTSSIARHLLVVGASLAGATTAATLREDGFDGRITLIGAEPQLPYERPALSKGYLTGETSLERLLVRPAAFYAQQDITLRLGEEAVGIDTDRRLVQLADGDALAFDALVITTGASNVRPPIPGISLDGVHQLRTVADADTLAAHLPRTRAAVTVGMGFIGCEIAATLATAGVQVTAVDGLPGPLWAQVGETLSGVVRRWHQQHGVNVRTGQSVAALLPDATRTSVAAVELADGTRLDTDLVVVGVGVRPNTSWLHDVPIHLVGGAVGVDVHGRTDVPGIYAAGDVTTTWDARLGRHVRHEHWASAIDQARRVARTITGGALPPAEVPYFWSTQYGRQLQYSGHHDPSCSLVLRGDPNAPFTAFFLRDNALAAVLTVDSGKELRRAQRLIGSPVDPQALADPTVDLRTLARPHNAAVDSLSPAVSPTTDRAG